MSSGGTALGHDRLVFRAGRWIASRDTLVGLSRDARGRDTGKTMNGKKIILIDQIPENLLSNLDSRDAALWVRSLPRNAPAQTTLVSFLGLPWRQVFSEVSDQRLLTALEQASALDAPMVRKRGFVQIVDSDPSRIEFPQRCLPFFLLNGREGASASEFESRLRRLTMLEELRRSNLRQVLVVSGDDDDPIPAELKELWASGFRSFLTFASDRADTSQLVERWLNEQTDVAAANLWRLPVNRLVEDIVARYAARYPEERIIIRVRDQSGTVHSVDVTEIDEPERPIFGQYSVLEDRDLSPITSAELSEDDFVAFFQNPESSWRPYAAGLPWLRNDECRKHLSTYLKRLDTVGSEENCIAYVLSEPGAGGTTLTRMLAWEYAREGYPVLVAKPLPFVPDALAVGNFLNRAHREIDRNLAQPESKRLQSTETSRTSRQYETPWVILFDRVHWEFRDSELVRFRNELERQGRPVCILVVSGPIRELAYFNISVFKQVAELNHTLDSEEALRLGRHLNQFLREYGKERQDWQWEQFYQTHTVRYLEGLAAFWVTLSFWIQGQYDLSQSIQEWVYRIFKENTKGIVRQAILEIAAMSSEHLPLPAGLLPVSRGEWPVSLLLEDQRSRLSGLGLVRIAADGDNYWALVHDILGRFLINALFYDFETRNALGFAEAKDADHLRFLLLRQISRKRELGERIYRPVGEDFATSIFKIDPDHGRGSFSFLWREVLDALDSMPRSLQDTSRVFRHHVAISRRRIAVLNENFYGVTTNDKIDLLNQAISDINFALSIEYTPGSESNLNLYNSLANAYLNLAQVEAFRGATPDRVIELRGLANDATRRAYEESPTNSYVVETFVKNLLANAKESSEVAVENCIEALGILFSAISSKEAAYRRPQLAELADQALQVLMNQVPVLRAKSIEPTNAIDVLIKAWASLAEGAEYRSGIALTEIPQSNRRKALEALEHRAGRGDMQVIRLTYDLICIENPNAFLRQLELAEQLQATDYRLTPQLRLEYAILLFQNGRAAEGDKIFRALRHLWRESEHFVHVPERLRWLRDAGGESLKTVQAVVASDYGHRAMARVHDFGNQVVPFRIEEFGFRELRPGARFAAHVSFGHNGPFLRPVTAGPGRD